MIPHPLQKFIDPAAPCSARGLCSGEAALCAAIILRAIQDLSFYPETPFGRTAREFLLFDTQWFPVACDAAGINWLRLRAHLFDVQRREAERRGHAG